MRKWYVQITMVFSKKEKIKKMTDNMIKLNLWTTLRLVTIVIPHPPQKRSRGCYYWHSTVNHSRQIFNICCNI